MLRLNVFFLNIKIYPVIKFFYKPQFSNFFLNSNLTGCTFNVLKFSFEEPSNVGPFSDICVQFVFVDLLRV